MNGQMRAVARNCGVVFSRLSIADVAPHGINPRWWAWLQSGERACESDNASFMIWIQKQWLTFREERGYSQNAHTTAAMHKEFDRWLYAQFLAAKAA